MSINRTRYLQHVPAEQQEAVSRAFARGSVEAEAIVRECRELQPELKRDLVEAICRTRE